MSLEKTHDDYWKMDNYIIITWSGGELDNVTDNLNDQMMRLKESTSWNNRAKFLLVVAGCLTEDSGQKVFRIVKEMWKSYRILNILLLVPHVSRTSSATDTIKGNIETSTYGLYTWFPYQSEVKCADVEDVVLIDRWVLENKGRFLKQVPLFPTKIHRNFHGCPLKISAFDVPPLVIRNNFTEEGNTDSNKYYGLEVDCCKFIAEALNMTTVFLPVSEIGLDAHIHVLGHLDMGVTDISFGAFPLHKFVYPFADPTVPYIDDYMNWYIPCGRPVPRTEKITEIFTATVWVMLGIVFTFSVFVMWVGAKRTKNSGLKESPSYMTISDVIQNIWAITLGLAATDMGSTTKLKSYLCLFVWYCFLMRALFQTYFTSFLVDPGIQERIRTLEELYQSDLVYNFYLENDKYLEYSFPDYYSAINLRRKECKTAGQCLYDLLRSQTFTVIDHSFHIDYSTEIIKKPELCTLDAAIYRLSFAMHLAKGSHLLDSFNDVIHRALQGGFVGKWWDDLKTSYKLLSASNHTSVSPNFVDFIQDDSDYFVFSVSHLQFAFYAIGMGGFVGFVVLIGEILHYRIFKKRRQVLTPARKVRHGRGSYHTVSRDPRR
jgi:hypothetical protein